MRGYRIENREGEKMRVTSDAAEVNTILVAVCLAVPLFDSCFRTVKGMGKFEKQTQKQKYLQGR